MREPNQRFWDAMIIRAWVDFKSTDDLITKCKAEFGYAPWNMPLKRNKHLFGGVRAWVATRLPLLSEKLWVLPKERYVELLDWLERSGMDCEESLSKNRTMRYASEAREAHKRSDLKATQATWSDNLAKTVNRSNQWTVAKGRRIGRRI
jgi:hypothetical protein